MKNLLRHASAFIAPVVMCILLPYWIIASERGALAQPFQPPSPVFLSVGLLVLAAGLALFVATARMFLLIGKGTIMPWDPTRKLIVAGVYRYVRNPMILGVLLVQAGLAIIYASWRLGLVALLFWVINSVYFTASEEPGLVKRFGAEYEEYRRNVPRWIPRRTPWHPTKG